MALDSGTGLVHQSPAFGAEDLAVCRAAGLPVVNPVQPNGRFAEGLEAAEDRAAAAEAGMLGPRMRPSLRREGLLRQSLPIGAARQHAEVAIHQDWYF